MLSQKKFDVIPAPFATLVYLARTMYVQPDDLWCDPYTDVFNYDWGCICVYYTIQ